MKSCVLWILIFLMHFEISAHFELSASLSYEGYKVYEIFTENQKDVKFLERFHNDQRFDFWSAPRLPALPVTVMVARSAVPTFDKRLKLHGLNHTMLIENVQRNFEKVKKSFRSGPIVPGEVSFTKYMRYHEINAYLTTLTEQYPNLVKTEVIGRSSEGRNITLIRISTGKFRRPTIFIDAGIHAREWLAPAMALYIINQIVENSTNSKMYENVDWAILPVTNPDGYEYSFTKNRFWRKTRSLGESEAEACYGADGNRNFDFHWSESGSSDDECDITFAGPKASSEPEVKAFSKFLLKNKNLIKLYVALHSYGKYILYPYSYDSVLPDNAEELQSLGEQVSAAIAAVTGTNYTVGNSGEVLYASSGCSDDYSMGVVGVPLAYTMELPGGGTAGFNPSEGEIWPRVSETFEGFKAFHKYVEDVFT